MTTHHWKFRAITWKLLALVIMVALLLVSCQPAAPAQNDTLQPAATDTLAPSSTPLPSATATPEPSETPSPTGTPTDTPVPPLAVVEDGISIWCLPEGISRVGLTEVMHERGVAGKVQNGVLSAHIPDAACTVVVDLNQSAPQGLMLGFYEEKVAAPWLEAELKTSSTNPAQVYASLDHTYIVNAPVWEITYRMMIHSADGKELSEIPIRFYRDYPGICPDRISTPVPILNTCPIVDPLEREPHPDLIMPWTTTPIP